MARRRRTRGSIVVSASGGKRSKTKMLSVGAHSRYWGIPAVDPASGVDPRLGKIVRAKKQARHPKGTRRGGQFR